MACPENDGLFGGVLGEQEFVGGVASSGLERAAVWSQLG
jgi:hypothetical protein